MQGYVACIIAGPPGHGISCIGYRCSVESAQLGVGRIETSLSRHGRIVAELTVGEQAVGVVHGHFGPQHAQLRDIGEIYHIVGISGHIVACFIKAVDTHVNERAECEAEYSAERWSSHIGISVARRHGRSPESYAIGVRSWRAPVSTVGSWRSVSRAIPVIVGRLHGIPSSGARQTIAGSACARSHIIRPRVAGKSTCSRLGRAWPRGCGRTGVA